MVDMNNHPFPTCPLPLQDPHQSICHSWFWLARQINVYSLIWQPRTDYSAGFLLGVHAVFKQKDHGDKAKQGCPELHLGFMNYLHISDGQSTMKDPKSQEGSKVFGHENRIEAHHRYAGCRPISSFRWRKSIARCQSDLFVDIFPRLLIELEKGNKLCGRHSCQAW